MSTANKRKGELSEQGKELGELRALKKQFEGIDPVRHAELLKASADAETKKLADKGDCDKILDQRNKDHQKELDAVKLDRDNMFKSLKNEKITNKAMEAIVAAGGEPELLLHIVSKQIDLVEEGGAYLTKVLDDNGGQRVVEGGKAMSIGDLITELKASPKMGRAFNGSGAGGSGASHGNGSGGSEGKTMVRSSFETMTPQAQKSFMKAGGTLTDK